jgi:nucleotide-binding universal stress UspA family protein
MSLSIEPKGEDDRMSIFPTKILFATDGSRDAEVAATTAVGLAKATGSELHVVTAAEEYPHYEAYWPLAERSRQLAQEVLDKQLKRIEKLGGTVDQNYLRIGTAAEEVVSLAEEIGAGLVAMGSRGKGGIRRLTMGSVSDSVVRHAHCPVIVVRGEPVVFPTRILLATDGSEDANLAASTAADLTKSAKSKLHVVCVEYTPAVFYELPGTIMDPALQGRMEEGAEESTKTKLKEHVQNIGDAGIEVAGVHTMEGFPDEEIVRLAGRLSAGLIVMGSRGLGPLRRALMGSVSDSVVRHAHCPVLVMRQEKERPAEHKADFLT